MIKTVKLTESDLLKIVKKIIKEQTQDSQCTKEEYLKMEQEYNQTLSEVGVRPEEINNYIIPSGLGGDQKMKLKEIVKKMKNMDGDQKMKLEEIVRKMENMDKKQLKNLLKELLSHKNQPVTESRRGGGLGPTLTILGLGAAAWLLAGPVIAFLIAAALVILGKKIFRGPCGDRGPRRGTFRRR